MTSLEFKQKFKDVTSTQNVDEQAVTCLRAFVGEFSGKFEEVLQLAEEFKTFSEMEAGGIQELNEFEAHRFLEKKGESKTVNDMREELAEIDLDMNKRVSFIEYLLFRYKKTLKDLFTAKPNAALLAKLERAINQYKAVFEEKKQREAKMAELEQRANAGDNRAKSELRRMQMDDPAGEAKNEMQALQQKLAAKRALRNPQEEEDRLYQKEQQRIAEQKAQAEAEEKRKQQESRNRLKERAALWN
jgi:hypothetical protein